MNKLSRLMVAVATITATAAISAVVSRKHTEAGCAELLGNKLQDMYDRGAKDALDGMTEVANKESTDKIEE